MVLRVVCGGVSADGRRLPAPWRNVRCMDLMWVPSPIIDAAVSILADGKARTANEILDVGRTRGLFDETVTRKHVYTSLSQYIERALGSRRKPKFTMDVEHRFRINHPPDDWPDLDSTGLPPLGEKPKLTDEESAAIDRVRKASAGSDPTEYELAICKLFSYIGFVSTRVGGTGTPDGYADAILGELTYRVMIECKLARDVVIARSDAPVEASKFKNGYNGTYCMLVAPAIASESSFISELRTHGVSAWTTEDLVGLLENGVNAFDARQVFATAGIAADALDDLYWERLHGQPKRYRVLETLIVAQARAMQRTDTNLNPAEAPRFTVDVAMAMVNAKLSALGASAGCKREEVEAVFRWLANPAVGLAIWGDSTQTDIVVVV